jgi:hypothetical protein
MSSTTETLHAGYQLTVVADASTTGTLERLSDVPSGASQGVDTITASTTTIKGPFAVPTRWRMTSTTGELTYSQAVDTRLDSTETGFLDGVTAGTATASKAVVLGASKEISTITTLTATNIDVGASGSVGTLDVFPATGSRGKLAVAVANQTGNTTVTFQVDEMGQATAVHLADPGAAASYVAQSTAALTLAEMDVLDGAVAGTNAASKVVIPGADGKVGAITFDGAVTQEVAPITTVNVGTVGTGVTAVERGDAYRHTTTLTLGAGCVLPAIAGGANEAQGTLIYTLPAGAELVRATKMSVAIGGVAAIQADTPDVGIGTTIATGVVAVLGGTAAFENLVTGQTAADCNGTATAAGPLQPTAGVDLFIATAGDHTIYLNAADGWAAGGDPSADLTGTVTLTWDFLG